ncbi:hypothetical protein GJ496_001445 [Pomphorhynchus laevis]|nr:hypothetical protein GJ496_001445 [Pomphorhynchus laevis]
MYRRVLRTYDIDKDTHLACNASDRGLGAVLFQKLESQSPQNSLAILHFFMAYRNTPQASTIKALAELLSQESHDHGGRPRNSDKRQKLWWRDQRNRCWDTCNIVEQTGWESYLIMTNWENRRRHASDSRIREKNTNQACTPQNGDTISTNVQRTVEMRQAESLDNSVETVPNVSMADITLRAENGQEQAIMKNVKVHNGSGVKTIVGNHSIPGDDQARRTRSNLSSSSDKHFQEDPNRSSCGCPPVNVTNDFDNLIIPLPLSNHALHLKQILSCSDNCDSDAVNQYSLCKRIVYPRDSGETHNVFNTLAGSDLCDPSSVRRIMLATVRNHPGTMNDLIYFPIAECLIVAVPGIQCALRQLENEHTGRACVENIGNTTTESPLDSSGTCENSSNSGSLDCDEPYTCREILKKHLRTKHPGQSDISTSSSTITPEVATASGGKKYIGMLRKYKIEVQDMSPKITGPLKMIPDYTRKEDIGEFCEGAKCHMGTKKHGSKFENAIEHAYRKKTNNMEDIIRQQAQTIARMQQNNEVIMKQLQGAINNKGDEKMEIEEESSIEMEYKSGQNKNKSEIKSIIGKHADKRVTERNMPKNGNQSRVPIWTEVPK